LSNRITNRTFQIESSEFKTNLQKVFNSRFKSNRDSDLYITGDGFRICWLGRGQWGGYLLVGASFTLLRALQTILKLLKTQINWTIFYITTINCTTSMQQQ